MLSNDLYQSRLVIRQRERFLKHYRNNTIAMIGLWMGIILIGLCLMTPWLAPYAPMASITDGLLPPSWYPNGHIRWFLGSDDLGRDMLSRLLWGSRITFGSAILIGLSASALGILIGILAGMTKGVLSSILNHLLDTILSLPSLLIAIIMVAFLGAGENNLLLAIWLSLIPRVIRATYQCVHQEIHKEYIIASRLDGAKQIYLLYHAILPNILPTLISEITRAISIAILDIATLGFLGLAGNLHSPEWGAMLGSSTELIYLAPWTITLPGLAILISVLTINFIGDGLQQALNAGTN